MENGLAHIYTGDGKGKTTAAIGLAVRAKAHHLNVCWISFHKSFEKPPYSEGEYKILKETGIELYNFVKYCQFENLYKSEEELFKHTRKDCLNAIKFIKEKIYDNHKNFDILILDEILISLREGYLSTHEILDLLNSKPKTLELILTGRCSDEKLKEIIKVADYVSKIEKIKHPFD
ncbi:MAG: cob(I)yrinic acid a,c-diamide adenosyltransferase, partial [Candidatus Altarchaeum sp.]|nr:cob(I)yrinic acid a,c-diamide adenosyltransferase [Candidatus Altarchaeum sp.]